MFTIELVDVARTQFLKDTASPYLWSDIYLTQLFTQAEECRISIRRHREEVWREIQNLERSKEITEDEKFRAKDELQKLIDEYNKKVEEMKNRKESEIMTI